MNALKLKIDKYLIYVIPVIAIAIYINQLYRQHAYDLSVWKGGGMGMFAAYDWPHRARYVHIHFIDRENGKIPLVVSEGELDALKLKLMTEPSEKNFNKLFQYIKQNKWFKSDRIDNYYSVDLKGEKKINAQHNRIERYGTERMIPDSVIIEFKQLFYDIDSKKFSAKTIKEREYEL